MHITINEINLQYVALKKTFEYMESRKEEIKKFYKKNENLSQNFVGCGSSYNLCQSGEFLVQNQLGKKSFSLTGGDILLNFDNYTKLFENSMTLIPTRSGSTSEILFAAEKIKQLNSELPIISIVCKENSKISKFSDLSLEIPWAFDESVCQTRSVTNLYTVILLLVAYFANDEKKIAQIKLAIENGEEHLKSLKPYLEKVASKDWSNVIILADGEVQGLATEGALAFTEIARIPGAYYHFLDVRHGPMVLINDQTLVIISLTNDNEKLSLDLINDILNKGSKVILYSEKHLNIDNINIFQIKAKNQLANDVQGINFINIPQLLSYYKACNKNINPDQPEGLDAWIDLG